MIGHGQLASGTFASTRSADARLTVFPFPAISSPTAASSGGCSKLIRTWSARAFGAATRSPAARIQVIPHRFKERDSR